MLFLEWRSDDVQFYLLIDLVLISAALFVQGRAYHLWSNKPTFCQHEIISLDSSPSPLASTFFLNEVIFFFKLVDCSALFSDTFTCLVVVFFQTAALNVTVTEPSDDRSGMKYLIGGFDERFGTCMQAYVYCTYC